MKPQRDTLSEALHELAATAPQASPELGVNLRSAFVRHHAQRRRKRAAIAFGLAACVAASLYWFGAGRQGKSVEVESVPQSAKAASPEPVVAPKRPGTPAPSVASTAVKPQPRTKQPAKARSHGVEAPPATLEAGDFVALPTFDPAIPLGQSRMVRMDLPGSALQLIGYPVDGQLFDRRILTDVLVGQDGTPYAVRFVPTRNFH
jgi:hypothetical protein